MLLDDDFADHIFGSMATHGAVGFEATRGIRRKFDHVGFSTIDNFCAYIELIDKKNFYFFIAQNVRNIGNSFLARFSMREAFPTLSLFDVHSSIVSIIHPAVLRNFAYADIG